MAKRELGSKGDFEVIPIVNITEKPGINFVGKMLDKGKEVKIGVYKKWVYAFELHDTDASTVVKGDDGKFTEVGVKEFDKVNIFASKLLNDKLSMGNVGEVIEINYKGMTKGKAGQEYHDFLVSVVE